MYAYPPFSKICAAFVVSLPFVHALPVAADEAVPTAVLAINDITPQTGFAPDTITDVLGLRIGMTFAEVEAALASADLPSMDDAVQIPDAGQYDPQRLGYRFKAGEVTPSLTWPDGFKMAFEPVLVAAGLTMYAEQFDVAGGLAEFANGQYLWLSFGGPSVGARVQEIHRKSELAEPVDMQVMLDSITEKYGPPSRIKDLSQSWIDIAYYHKDSELLAEEDRRRARFALNCKPPGATRGSSDILYSDQNVGGWFGPARDPRSSGDFCDAALFVRLHYGDVPNTIDAIDVHVMDYVARWENWVAVSTQAGAVHAEWLESVAGSSTAPDL